MAAPVAAEAPTLAVNAPPEPLLLASEETSPQRQLIAALNHVVDTRHDEALAVLRAWIAEGRGRMIRRFVPPAVAAFGDGPRRRIGTNAGAGAR